MATTGTRRKRNNTRRIIGWILKLLIGYFIVRNGKLWSLSFLSSNNEWYKQIQQQNQQQQPFNQTLQVTNHSSHFNAVLHTGGDANESFASNQTSWDNNSSHGHFNQESQFNPSTSKAMPNITTTAITTPTTITTRKPTLIVGGTVRSCVKHIPQLLKSMERLQQNFEIVAFIFVENDSTDKTVPQLNMQLHRTFVKPKQQQRRRRRQDHNIPSIQIHQFYNLRNQTRTKQPSRVLALAYARNQLWKFILNFTHPSIFTTATQQQAQNQYSATTTTESKSVDYVLLMDMDDVNYELRGVHHCHDLFQSTPNASVCCANQYHVFYDLWALRAEGWMDFDPQYIPLYQRKKRQHHISARRDPIPVKSCFGGAALYSYQTHLFPYLQGHYINHIHNNNNNNKKNNNHTAPQQGEASFNQTLASHNNSSSQNLPTTNSNSNFVPLYEGINERGDFTCEHVSFHMGLQNATNSTLWIQPKMLNNGPFNLLVRRRFMHPHKPILAQSFNDSTLAHHYPPEVQPFLWQFLQ